MTHNKPQEVQARLDYIDLWDPQVSSSSIRELNYSQH